MATATGKKMRLATGLTRYQLHHDSHSRKRPGKVFNKSALKLKRR